MLHAVEFEITGAQQQARFPLAAQQGAAAGAELVQAEGLGHQVVGAAVEAAHAGFDFLPAGENQDREVGLGGANLLKHVLAVFDRKVEIEDCQVRQILAKCLDGSAAVHYHAHAVSIGFEPSREKHSQRAIIFGNQQPHQSSPSPAA